MINKARTKFMSYANISYIIGDVYTHDFASSSYDLIICYSVFPHLEDKELILKKFYKILKKEGYLVILHSESRRAINELHKNVAGVVEHDHLPRSEEVAKMAEKIDYSVNTLIDDEIYFLMFKK